MPNNTAPQGGMTLEQLQGMGATPVSPITQPINNGGMTLQQLQQQGAKPIDSIEGPQLHDTGSFGGNLANSAGNFLSGIGHAIAHPIDTVKGLYNTGLGEAEKLIPGRQGAENQADAFNNFYKQRYGSFDNFVKTMKQDPIGALADASAVLGIAGGAAGAIGKLGGIDEAIGAGKALGAASNATNPFMLPQNVGKGLSAAGGKIAGFGSNVEGMTGNAISGVGNKVAGAGDFLQHPLESAKGGLKNLQDSLTQSTLHMSPVQKNDYMKAMPDIVNYIENNLPAGDNFKQLEAVNNDYTAHEAQIQKFLEDSTNSSTGVSRQGLIDVAEGLKKQFRTQRDAMAIDKQIDDFVATLESKHSDVIPLTDLNSLKRSTYENAYNNAGTKVSDDVEKAIGDALKSKLEEATNHMKFEDGSSLADFNKKYSTIIKTRQLLKKASGKNQLGFAGKMTAKAIGGIAGAHSGGILGAAVGGALGDTVAEKVAGNAAHSYAAKAAGAVGKTIPKIKVPAKALKAANILVRINNASK